MTEAEARNLLRADQGGGLESWMAEQPWRSALGGGQLSRELDGWRFRLHPIEDGLQVRRITVLGLVVEVCHDQHHPA